jgi:hypothetical protein
MSSELPIACSLDSSELSQRLAEIAALGRDALLDARVDDSLAQLRFAARAGIRDRVEQIVDAESRCCAFLQMRVSEEPGTVVLTIEAPAEAQLVLDELVAAFGPTKAQRATYGSARIVARPQASPFLHARAP